MQVKRVHTVLHYDAFSKVANMGNPAGIVPNGDLLTDAEMQATAKAVGFNETVFLCRSDKADYRFRYFTPGHEINLCGHGTIAGVFHLHEAHLPRRLGTVTIETKAGIISTEILKRDGEILIKMAQASPMFMPYTGDVDALAATIGISPSDIDGDLPIVYGSTGAWTLLVPIKNLTPFSQMCPQTQRFPHVLMENPRSSIHPFCFSALTPNRHVHSRHFSSPFSGTVEDAVTGTASGAIGAYYATYVDSSKREYYFVMEQGRELGRNGEVCVHVIRVGAGLRVCITGTAIYVDKIKWID